MSVPIGQQRIDLCGGPLDGLRMLMAREHATDGSEIRLILCDGVDLSNPRPLVRSDGSQRIAIYCVSKQRTHDGFLIAGFVDEKSVAPKDGETNNGGVTHDRPHSEGTS